MRSRVAFAILLVLGASTPASAGHDGDPARVDAAISFLAGTQPASGAWPNIAYIVEAAASAGLDVTRWPTAERSAWRALAPERCPFTDPVVRTQPDPSRCPDYEYKKLLRTVHAAGTSGHDPRDINGLDGVAATRANFTGGQFGDPTFYNDDMWAILALRAAGISASDEQIQTAAELLKRAQLSDGGWHHQVVGTTGDLEITGFALAALRAAGVTANERAARAFVLGKWDPATRGIGGGTGVNVQTTVWGIHALAALGIAANESVLDYLRGKQGPGGRMENDTTGWSTAEATVVLAGARFPLPGYAPPMLTTIVCHAGETAAIRPASPFTRIRVEWEDGREGAVAFERAGAYRYHYLLEGPGIRARGEGILDVLSARPRSGALPSDVSIPRNAPLSFDLRNASDPDGVVVAFEIDWGDGNVTANAAHAYPLPGTYPLNVRVRDNDGVWSHPARVNVTVTNAPPVLSIPPRIVADRVTGIALNVTADDPEGDGVTLRWTFGARSGDGAPRFVPTATGIHSLVLRATDAFGAQVNATAVVEVVNLPPSVRFLDDDEPAAEAADPDGPPPSLAWSVDGAPADPPLGLAPGSHVVRVTATDADGATASAARTFVVHAPEDEAPPSTAVAPAILAFDPRLVDGELRGDFLATPADARAMLAWQSDAGAGEREVGPPFSIPLAGATWATARLTVEHDGVSVSRESALLVPPPEPARSAASAPSPATVLVVAAPPEEDQPLVEVDLEPATLNELPAGRQETPLAPTAAAIALLLATLGTLSSSRARSQRRERR